MTEELPENAVEILPVEDNRELIERIADKNWKVRVNAYEDLKKKIYDLKSAEPIEDGVIFTSSDELLREYASWLPKMTSDSNANALDIGFDTAITFVDISVIEIFNPFIDKMFVNCVDKAFSGKTLTIQKGKTLLLKIMEITDPVQCVSYLLTRLADKKPKIPPLCLEIVKEALVMFGVKGFPVKDVIKALPTAFNSNNNLLRDAAMDLTVEMHKWIGVAPLQALVDSLRTAQKTDFEKILSERVDTGRPVPTVYTRKERPAVGQVLEEVSTTTTTKDKQPVSDLSGDGGREYVDEVDLVKKLKSSEFSNLIAEEKWSEQLKGLQLVVDFIGPVPKIKAGSDVHDIVSHCKAFLRQGHLQLQLVSLKILLLLADGLRAEFSNVVRPILQLVISKFKEKRLVPEVLLTLQMVLQHCSSFDVMLEDINEMLKNKKEPPHCKVGVMELSSHCLKNSPEKIGNDSLKSLADGLVCNCEDSDPKVRDASCNSLAALMAVVKARGKPANDANKVISSLEQSAPRVFNKLKQISSGQTDTNVSTKTAAETISKPTTTVETKPKAATTSVKSSSVPSSNGNNASKKVVKTSSTSGASNTNSKKVNDEDEVEELNMTEEDAIQILAGLEIDGWDSSFQTLMSSAKWQEKVDALAILEKNITESNCGGKYSDALIKYLSSQTNGFKISNINILKGVMSTSCAAAKYCGEDKFSRSGGWELIKQFGDKLSDKKTKDLVQNLLTALSETISPMFVVKRMKSVMDKTKAPVAHQYYLEWMKTSVSEFGFGAFNIQTTFAFCQEEMENKVSTVRTAAIEVLGSFYHQIGPKIWGFLSCDDKPQLKTLLEAEFLKVGYDPSSLIKASKSASGDGSGQSNSLNSIPRQDIMSVLDKNIMSELNLIEGKTSWQNRKAAMESIIALCEKSGHYIDYNKGSSELVKALKARINDTQANLKPLAVAAIGHLISSFDCESGCKILKVIAGSIMLGLADNKKPMRDATISALQMSVTFNKTPPESAIADVNMMSVLVQPVCESLANTVGRQELINWLLLHVDSIKGDQWNELASPLIVAMQDKTASVRAAAEQLLSSLASRAVISKMAIEKATRDLPPATKRSLQSAIDRIVAVAGTKKAVSVTQTITAAAPVVVKEPTPLVPEVISAEVVEDHVEDEDVPISRSSSETSNAPIVKRSGILPPSKHASSKIVQPSQSRQSAVAAVPIATVDDPWLLKKSTTGKVRRLEEFYKLNWPQPPTEPGEFEFNQLKTTWEPLLSPDLAFMLFPGGKIAESNHDSFVPAINELSTQLECPYFMQHTDLILRWCSIILSLRESSTGLLRLLQLINDIFVTVQNPHNALLHDSEISSLIPHLIEKCGHKSDRHKQAFKKTLISAGEIIAPNKINQHLIVGLHSVNKKSRIVSIEEIQRVVESAGVASLGRAGVKDIGDFLDAKDNDLAGRSSCLELIYSIYISLGADLPKLKKLLGDISSRSISMIEDRIKQKTKLLKFQQIDDLEVSSHLEDAIDSTNESHSLMLQKIDEVIASTPLPKSRKVSTGFESETKEVVLMSPEQSSTLSTVKSAFKSPGLGEFDLESIYVDIISKTENLTKNTTILNETDILLEEAKDYLKIFHSILNNEWTVEKNPEDDKLLLKYCEPITNQVLLCISRSFDIPPSTPKCSGINIGIDVSLVAISLSILFSVVKNVELVDSLSETCIFNIFYRCLSHICDPRITNCNSDTESIETCQQIVRAFNMTIVKLAYEANTSVVLCQLLQVMFLCLPESEVSHEKGFKSLPTSSTKPTSRLIVKILTDEANKISPYSDNSFNLKKLLLAIHNFFSKHPANTSDDTPFRTAKTVLNEIIKSIGGYKVISLLQETSISSNAFIYLLTSRLGNVSISETNTELHGKLVAIIDNITSARDKVSAIKELHRIKKNNPNLDINLYLHKISSAFRRFVLDTLTKLDLDNENNENEDTANSVPEYSVADNNSDLVNKRLSHVVEKPSSLFNTAAGPRSPTLGLIDQNTTNTTTTTSVTNTESKASEAMRILEGLKNRQSYLPSSARKSFDGHVSSESMRASSEVASSLLSRHLGSSGSTKKLYSLDTSDGDESVKSVANTPSNAKMVAASPFARRNDKIRDSLINLTAVLDISTSMN